MKHIQKFKFDIKPDSFCVWNEESVVQAVEITGIKSIHPDGTAHEITKGEKVFCGDTVEIGWWSKISGGNIDIYVRHSEVDGWTIIAKDIPANDKSYTWVLPNIEADDVSLQIRWKHKVDYNCFNISDSSFGIRINDQSSPKMLSKLQIESTTASTTTATTTTTTTTRPPTTSAATTTATTTRPPTVAPTKPALNAPIRLRIISDRYNSMPKLAWVDNSDDETGFVLERKHETGKYVELVRLAPNTTEYTDNDASTQGTHYYRIKAIRAADSSAYSNEVDWSYIKFG